MIYNEIKHMEPITKGWSEDKKYCITTTDNMKYLLRITPISRYETRKSLFNLLERLTELDIPMCKPIEFGICEDGVYNIQSWIYGEDLEEVLPSLSETEQYMLGYESGEILRKIHSIPVPNSYTNDINVDTIIQNYRQCGIQFDGDEHVIAYIEQNRSLLAKRPKYYQHGDYSIRNMMLENGRLKIIDFDRYGFGDPWEEFYYVMLEAEANPYFVTGQFRGYFNGQPSLEFFKLYAFYISLGLLSAVSDGVSPKMNILEWFDNMQNPVPKWYLKTFCVQWKNDIPQGIIVFGANGSGKTTFGRELAHILNYKHMDHEAYAFNESEMPYTNPRSNDECMKLMLTDIEKHHSFVLSAVTGDFGDIIPQFYKLAVFINVPLEIRIERIKQRELLKFGNRVLEGGDMYEQRLKFLDFVDKRPLLRIDEWSKTLTCPVIEIDGTKDLHINAMKIAKYILKDGNGNGNYIQTS